jgi:hypothetical protein
LRHVVLLTEVFLPRREAVVLDLVPGALFEAARWEEAPFEGLRFEAAVWEAAPFEALLFDAVPFLRAEVEECVVFL